MRDIAEQPLGELARSLAVTKGDAPALSFEGRTTSYQEFNRHACQVANGLIAANIKPGDRVAYLGKNSDLYFEILYGAAKAGAVLTPVNWRLAPPEITHILSACKARAVFVGAEFVATISTVRTALPDVEFVVTLDGAAGSWPNFTNWREAQPAAEPEIPVSYADVALQLYTSGTTGTPKGAMLRHCGLLGLIPSPQSGAGDWARWSAQDAMLVAMPVFHIAGTGAGLWALKHGVKAVVLREFDTDQVLDFIERERPSKLFLVPTALQLLVRHPRARTIDYSCLQYILYGASPIPLALLRECMEVFNCRFAQGYGMTETSGTIAILPPEDHDVRGNARMRSAGRPLPGVEIAIVDENGKRLPARAVGEIVTRSIGNMAGYWNMPEDTRRTIDSEGWLRTGDAGYLDEDGYLYIRDRVKDMIISGAENVYPAEVENAIHGHPAVADVAVIGVPDAKWGEAVKAIVVAKPGSLAAPEDAITKDLLARDIIEWARQRIAAYKLPKSVDFVPGLPRNAAGKVLKRQLREPYWAGTERNVN